MPSEGDLKKRVVRKLTKKRKEDHQATMEIPEKFKDGDDADEDCTAPKGPNIFLNQSVFGMIAAAGGSQVDFNARFDGSMSDDEESGDGPSQGEDADSSSGKTDAESTVPAPDKHRRQFSESKLMRSLPHLKIRPLRSKSRSRAPGLPHAGSQELEGQPSPVLEVNTVSKGPPVMGRMLEAQAELSSRPSFDLPRRLPEKPAADDSDGEPSILAMRLMEIFGFEKPEEVIEEYPCWLLKSVLLQGYMYITTKHICFYAYLPKKSNVVAKSGYLSKRGLKNPKYHRYWFRLKGDVLSYYTDPSDLYFPSGNIDLRYGISASIADKEKGKDTTYFTVITNQRKFYFKADSAPSAKEWVKALQKIIFRSHNEGDSVKISLPIENVIDVEDSHVVDFAQTCKIRVIDNDETYAIDEYFFSFFNYGKEALNVLRVLVEGTTAHQLSDDYLKHRGAASGGNSPVVEEPKHTSINFGRESSGRSTPVLGDQVKATLSPTMLRFSSNAPSPRNSGEFSRGNLDCRRSTDVNRLSRRSVEVSRITDTRQSTDLSRFNMDGQNRSRSTSRRSLSRSRQRDIPASERQGSSDSYVHSLEDPGSSALAQSTSDDTQGSASQILRGSEVFFSPTIRRSLSASRQKDEDSSLGTRAISHSPTRAPTIRMPKPRHAMTTGADGFNMSPVEPLGSGHSLQSLVRAGAYPLQRAAGFASYLNQHSKRMSSMLATESMGYVEKVSGMWKGGKKHYDELQGIGPDADLDEGGDHGMTTKDRFRGHFALPASEKLQATYFGYLHRVLPLYGKIYISNRSFCFRSMLPGSRTKLILPLKDIENVDKEKGFRFGYSGLVIVIRGHEELFFEFGQPDTRDDCAITLLQNLETIRYLQESGLLSQEEKDSAEIAVAEHKALQEARQDGGTDIEIHETQSVDETKTETQPILFDDPRASILNFKPVESLRITCLTIGSRGDVQPYIALCKGLIAEGHRPKIATHDEFKDWVESHGIEFAPVAGDPAELMRICVEYGMFTYSFLKEATSKFRVWIDELLTSAWAACQDTDLLIESPSAMAGIHIAEALEIPYFRAFTMPWTRTRAYPHAFAVPEHKMGGAYNYITYVMFDNVFWKAIAGQVNRWRKKELKLQRTSLEKMQPNKIPFLYNFSPSVVVPPLDYSDWIRVTGYWFLNEGGDWTPPKELTDFIAKARADKKKIVYIGFGSIVVSDSAALTRTVIKSVEKADVRCILSKGWSDRLDKEASNVPDVPIPDTILLIKSAPHDWLFKQVDAAAHHGGAGTTGASLKAGIPTIIKPFFGDQFFFGSRIEDLGVGIFLRKLNVSVFSRALWEACHSERIIAKSKCLGEKIKTENGVSTAIQSLYRDLEYAKSLIKRKDGKVPDDVVEDSEESWTFIGDDNDPEVAKRIHDWELMAQSSSRAGRDSLGNRALRTGSGTGTGTGTGSGVSANRLAV